MNYNRRMSDLPWLAIGSWLTGGLLSGFIVVYLWELRTRHRLHAAAARLGGEWIAHNMVVGDGRRVDRSKPMENAWPTVMTPKRHWWAEDSHILDIRAADIAGDGRLRPHGGYLIIDRVSPKLATRIIWYSDSDEVSEQRIVISLDEQTLHVFPRLPDDYHRHALCRRAK